MRSALQLPVLLLYILQIWLLRQIVVITQHAEAIASLRTICGRYARTIVTVLTLDNKLQIKRFVKSDPNKQFRQKSRSVQVPNPDTKNPQQSNDGGTKHKRGVTSVHKKDTPDMLTGWHPNKNGLRASPAVRHMIKTLHQLAPEDKKRILPEFRKELLIENIAAKYVSSGNQDAMIQKMQKLTDNDNDEKALSQTKKKVNSKSQHHQNNPITSAMMVTSSNRSGTPLGKKH
jgi:hypothetical protein